MASKTQIDSSLLQLLIDNLPGQVPKMALPVNGKAYTPSQVVAMAKLVVTARQAAQTAKGTLASSKDKVRQTEATYLPILANVRTALVTYLGGDAEKMASLGVAGRKQPAPRTLQQKIAAREKNLATRAARGTKGKKQKAAITGNVTGVVVTPLTGSGSAATSPTGSPQVSALAASVSTVSSPAVPVSAPVATGGASVSTTAFAPAAPLPSISTTTAPAAAPSPSPASPATDAVAVPAPSLNGTVVTSATTPLTNGAGH